MASMMEARVARSRNIRYEERSIAQTVSDFYLLEALGYIKGDQVAKKKLLNFEAALAKEFASYLDIAVGGELRYARSMLGDECPKRLKPFLKEASLADRGTAWLVWGVIRRAWGLDAVRLAKETFETDGWRGAFGGDAWATIASVLLAYLEGKMNDRIFVDRCLSLEHNSGVVFNKIYPVNDVPTVLGAHGNDEYETLLEHSSEEVRCLWRRQEVLIRAEHDPVWLGDAYPYTMTDVLNWEDKYGWRKS
jgi:hypothetical protein